MVLRKVYHAGEDWAAAKDRNIPMNVTLIDLSKAVESLGDTIIYGRPLNQSANSQ